MRSDPGPAVDDRDGRVGRRAAFVFVAYAFVVVMLSTNLPTPLYPIYRREIGFSELTVTVVFATYAFGVVTALIAFGRLSDQIGRRPMLLLGLGFSAASAMLFLFQGGLTPILAGRYLSGLSSGIFTGTATATLVDLAVKGSEGRATLVATAANMGGLGLGPLSAGVLAEWLPFPLRLTFVADLALVVVGVAVVLAVPETVPHRTALRLRVQRPGVPPEVRSTFAGAATAGFAGFAVLGLFSGVSPAFLATVLGYENHALAGLVVFFVFGSSLVGQRLLGLVPDRWALAGGCGLLVGGAGILAGGLGTRSLALLIAGGVVAGIGQGLSFRAGLAAVNEASPPDRRGEVASSYFIACYVAISIPIIGVGLAAREVGLRTSGLAFTAGVAALAVTAAAAIVVRLRDNR